MGHWPIGRLLGIGLITLSAVLYAGVLALPLIPGEVGARVAAGAALVVAGEIAFWAGTALVGREVVLKYLRRLDARRLLRRGRARVEDP